MNINELKIFLKNNSNASSISLDRRNIDDDMAIIIAEFLEKNKSLKKLDLSNKWIGGEREMAIAKGLKKNKSLSVTLK